MASKVIRITMFKIPKKEDQQKIAGFYKLLSESANKDGKPYILSLAAGPAYEDARSQGFTFVARSEFKDLEDMKFYDEGCVAHQELKKSVKTLSAVDGVMTVYYTPEIVKD